MGLDIYVGSLSRYLVGDWELLAQQAAREMGMRVNVVRPADPQGAIRDAARLQPIVEHWRDCVSRSLQANLDEPLDWDESAGGPYFTDRPDWDSYSSLLLFAAREEQPQCGGPRATAEPWQNDPAYRASIAEGFPSRYSHLLAPRLWLPCDFPFVFDCEFVTGSALVAGSSAALCRQLDDLNSRTWQAGAATQKLWRFDAERGEKFGFAIVRKLAGESVARRLPMLLDY